VHFASTKIFSPILGTRAAGHLEQSSAVLAQSDKRMVDYFARARVGKDRGPLRFILQLQKDFLQKWGNTHDRHPVWLLPDSIRFSRPLARIGQ
jgi:hypothetical protein